jgi:SAM-dependent methyltransferase
LEFLVKIEKGSLQCLLWSAGKLPARQSKEIDYMLRQRIKRIAWHGWALLQDAIDLVAQRLGKPIPPLSRTEIIWAYRSILDREPRDGAEIQAARKLSISTAQLRGVLVATDEYRAHNPPLHLPALDGHEPPITVELVDDPEQLQHLLTHVQATWQHLGETEPYWSVVTGERFRMANIEQARAEFYQSGQPDAGRLLRTLERNGIRTSRLRTCLEYGCGVGRVTRWLAPQFDQLYACDISLAHLQSAEQYLRQEQQGNVVYLHIQSLADLEPLPPVDLVYSVIVLQHNPPPVISALLDLLLHKVKPGGFAYFQTPTYRLDYHFHLATYLAEAEQRQEMEMHLLPQSEIFALIARHGAQVVEVLEDAHTGLRYKERSNSFLVRKLAE